MEHVLDVLIVAGMLLSLAGLTFLQIVSSMVQRRHYLQGLGKIDMYAPKTWYEKIYDRLC